MTDVKPAVSQPASLPYTVYRKWFGLALVTASALAYGLVSQLINRLFLPGIPLYQPPFGALGNILIALLIGVMLGIGVAWAESGAGSVLWGSFLGAFFIALATLLSGPAESAFSWQKIFALAIIFVPVAAVLAPFLIVFRWAIGREEQNYRDASKGNAPSAFRRYAVPAGLVLAAGIMGAFALYNDLARAALPRMQTLIQQGQQAQNVESLPEALHAPDVQQFFEQGRAPYTLQWEKDDQNRFSIPRPAGSGFDTSIVIARYENGYQLVCLFPNKTGQPNCRDFSKP